MLRYCIRCENIRLSRIRLPGKILDSTNFPIENKCQLRGNDNELD